MKITENNYEEYFLLYVDDELNAQERLLVETFIMDHPTFAALMELFLQTKLPENDSIVFTAKECLLKTDVNEIGIDNYEEYFLLYADNELTKEKEEETERFVLQHPRLQQEFTYIKRARLEPEPVILYNKEILYRKESRVVFTYLLRAGIAASICVAVALAWFFTPATHHLEIASNVNEGTIKKRSETSQLPVSLPNSNHPVVSTENGVNKKETQSTHKLPLVRKESKIEQKNLEIVVTPPHNIAIEARPPTQTAIAKKEPDILIATPAEVLKPLEEVKETASGQATALSLIDNDVSVKPAVYKELNTDGDNQSVYVGALQLNKARVNGFLKSASRILGSKVKQNTE